MKHASFYLLVLLFPCLLSSSEIHLAQKGSLSDMKQLPSREKIVPNMAEDSLHQVVLSFHQGFIDQNPMQIRQAIGDHLMMINGNYSGDPIDWQAHQFLNDEEIDAWIEMMLTQAGPFENHVQILRKDIRANAAIVITQEQGKNRFRSWEKEQVAYLLGRVDQQWKMLGLFIKDLKNPE